MITQVLNRLKLWQKLGWLVLAMAIPAALVGFFYLRLADTQVSQARDELEGARYLQGLSAVEGEILTHRSRAFVFLSGDAARRGDVIAQQEEVEKADRGHGHAERRLRQATSGVGCLAERQGRMGGAEVQGPTAVRSGERRRHAALTDHLAAVDAARQADARRLCSIRK